MGYAATIIVLYGVPVTQEQAKEIYETCHNEDGEFEGQDLKDFYYRKFHSNPNDPYKEERLKRN